MSKVSIEAILERLEFSTRRVPVILQTEAAECGLACLTMIASHHGFRTDLSTLRTRFSLSLKGCNLAQLVRYANDLNLFSRPLRPEADELSGLKLPCILHWNLNHFVVLQKVEHKVIVIHDPSIGVRRMAHADVSKHFTGVALELTRTLAFKAADEVRRVSLRGLMGTAEGLWKSLGLILAMALALALALALEIFGLLSPMFNQWVVDEALMSADRDLLNVLLIGFFLMLIIQTTISLARSWAIMYLATHLNLQWTANVFRHMLRLPVA